MTHLLLLAASVAIVAKATAIVVTSAFADAHDEANEKKLESPDADIKTKKPNALVSVLLRADNDYQSFVRTRIDPLLAGRSRDEHLKALISSKARTLSIQERRSNRRLGLGFAALVLLLDVYVTGIPLLPVIIIIGVYNLFPWFKEGFRLAVKEKRFGIIHLISLYFAVMWLGGYFLIGVIGSIFSGFCQKIQVITQVGARNDLIDVLGQKPQKVWIDVNGMDIEIPFEQLRIGYVLVLDAGQLIPVDGVIVDGWALVDQHRLTGEAQPVEKTIGDSVFAATLVLGGRLRVRVEKSGDDTTAAKIADVLKQTVEYEVDHLRAQFASVEHTVWPMMAGGLFGWLVAGPVAGAAVLGSNYVVGVVPLRMITLLNALSAGSENGVLIKDGRALEALQGIDTLVFDKTGTLTLEQPHIIAIHICAGHDENEVLAFAATAEHRQTHPIALAILAEAQKRNLELPNIDETFYEVGYGLKVKLDNVELLVGSYRFMELEHIVVPTVIQTHIARCNAEGRSLVYVAVGGVLVGAIELDAALRPEALAIVGWLKQRGLELYIISGDQEAPTRRLAEELNMDGYFSNVLPEGKATLIQTLQADGKKVCFIGDGINDAIALRKANVSVSFRGATTVASDSAQIVLMDDNLEQLKLLFELAHAYDDNLAANYRQAVNRSLVAAAAVLVLPYKFVIVEGFWILTFVNGIRIATRSLLNPPKEEVVIASTGGVEKLARDPS